MKILQPEKKESNLFIDTLKEIPETVSKFKSSVSNFLRPAQTTQQIQQERRQTILPTEIKKIKTQQANQNMAYSPTSDPMKFYKNQELYIDPNFVGSLEKIGQKAVQKVAPKVFQGFRDLTTKTLRDLEGRSTVSKQYILDATNRGELKQVERDLIRDIVEKEGDTINVSDFAKKVKAELLPLKIKKNYNANYPKSVSDSGVPIMSRTKFESISLPAEIRGKVKNYDEHLYESPIKTSAGSTHFPNEGIDNYFGHTRIEDMADNKTRRVIEVQSDLYQKGNLESEIAMTQKGIRESDLRPSDIERWGSKEKALKELKKIKETAESRKTGLQKLQQYNDPTAHFRMVREEIKKASQDGKTKLQFPTGETAMKIEGLGDANKRMWQDEKGAFLTDSSLSKEKTVRNIQTGEKWFITEKLPDGKFKALPDGMYESWLNSKQDISKLTPFEETFDISGKVDTNNPIYKFYEKDMQKYLTKFGGKRVVDDKGVEWIEVPINKEQGKAPVDAFGRIKVGALLGAAGASSLFVKGMQPSTITYKKEDGVITQKSPLLPSQPNKKKLDSIRQGILHAENEGATSTGQDVYKVIGYTGDIGKYQVNPKSLNDWSEAWLGKKYTPQEFKNDPDAQERFFNEFLRVVDRLKLTEEQAAIAWHRGWGELGIGSRETRDKRFKDKLKSLMTDDISQAYLDRFKEGLQS